MERVLQIPAESPAVAAAVEIQICYKRWRNTPPT